MEKVAEYISDGSHNYLRINCGEERKDTYPYKMITENAIKGLLPCRIRVVNGSTYLYYEIQSRQSFYYRYEMKEIDYEVLKNLFFHLCLLGDELEKYFLDFNDISFDENYIFQDMESGDTAFLFLPDKGVKRRSFAEFMEYLVRKVNHKDAKAVQTAYQLYDLSRQEHILVKEIRRLFEEEEKSAFQTQKEERNIIDSELREERKSPGGEEQQCYRTEERREKEESWKWENSEEKAETERAKWSEILIPVFLCVAFTVLVCIKLSVKLTYSEETVLIAGFVVVIGLFIAYTVYRIWTKREKKKETVKTSIRENDNYYEWEDMKAEYYKSPAEAKTETEQVWQYMREEKEENYGATVFLEQEPENILCGLGKYEKFVIKLEHFPFSVGKLKEETDYVLKDNSVSRLHARLYQENRAIYIVDLNSTNGTYKNGFRIPSNEKVRLEEGDEIVFGKVRFCYR